jgi:hypothetical protein
MQGEVQFSIKQKPSILYCCFGVCLASDNQIFIGNGGMREWGNATISLAYGTI